MGINSVNGTSAGDFFWSQLDKSGNGKLDNDEISIFNNPHGFQIREGMTKAEFIHENSSMISQIASTDKEYHDYQWRNVGSKDVQNNDVNKMLSEIGKLFEPLAHKQKPPMELSENSFKEEKDGENYSD